MKNSSDPFRYNVKGQNFLIVGGGIRGLLAAYELVKKDVLGQKIKIIDAAEKVGGAINTELEEMSAAEFIDDEACNPELHNIIKDIEDNTKRQIIKREVVEDERAYIDYELYDPDKDIEMKVITLLNREKDKCQEGIGASGFEENDKKSLDHLFNDWYDEIKSLGCDNSELDRYFRYLRKSYKTFNGISNDKASALTFILQAQVSQDEDGKDVLDLFPGERVLINSAELVLGLKEYLKEKGVIIATKTPFEPQKYEYPRNEYNGLIVRDQEGNLWSNIIFAIDANSMAQISSVINEEAATIEIMHAKWNKAFVKINDPKKAKNFPICNFIDKSSSVSLWLSDEDQGRFTFFYSGEVSQKNLAEMFNMVAQDSKMDDKISEEDIKPLEWHNSKANCSPAFTMGKFTIISEFQKDLKDKGINFIGVICPLDYSFGYVNTAVKSCQIAVSEIFDPAQTFVVKDPSAIPLSISKSPEK